MATEPGTQSFNIQNWTLKLQQLQTQLADRHRPAKLQIGTHLELADLFEQARNYSAALEQYRSALTISPTCIEAILGQAQVLHHLQRYDDAIALYNQALTQRPNRAEIWRNRGRTTAAQGHLDKALTDYAQALTIDPNQPQTWHEQGDLLDRLGRQGGAIISHAEALARQPLGDDPLQTDCLYLDRLGPFVDRYRRAFSAIDAAIATHPQRPQLWLKLADRLVEEGFAEEAITSLQTALSHCPRSSALWLHQGKLLGQADRWTEAEASYERALALSVASGDLVGEIAVRDALALVPAKPTLSVAADRPPGFWATIRQQLPKGIRRA
jgi:tetratricopeptide (TPR) repeat protein